jgi:type II secretory pathway pseudopilin PulG
MKPRISNHKAAALTRVEVLVVISIVAVLTLIFFRKTELEIRADRLYSANILCVNNQKEIALSFRAWAGDHNDKFPMQVSVTNGGTMELANGENAWINFFVMSNKLSTPKVLICPADTDKIAANSFTAGFDNSKISYFVGLDANDTYPQMFLSGDDNFEISGIPIKSGLLEVSTNTPIAWTAARHKFHGEITFADGSVNPSSNKNETHRLTDYIQQTGVATNRLAIP